MALEEALETRPARSAWVRCTEADRDAGRLLGRVVGALLEAAPGAADVLAERLAAAQERINVHAASDELVGELGRLLVDQVVIVFDDAEHLHDSPDAVAVVDALLAAGSQELRTAVATRRPPRLRLAKLRGAGRLTEFGPGELAFGLDECGELLRLRRDRPAAPEEVDRLFAATEGWPLGVSLSVLHGGAHSFGGVPSRARLFEFLDEEVLERLPPPLRELVIDSSVPDELNRGCMRVLGLPDDFPERAAQAGLLLRAVDAEGVWLSYHPLVRDFLRERAAAERTPAARRELHARVARALAAASRPEQAIEHWLVAEAWPEAAEALAQTGPALLHTAPATLRSWLDALPPDLRAAPACQLLEGTLEWGAGRNIEAVDCLRSAAAGFSEKEDVVGEWLARFALADPLVLMGELEQVIPLANGFDDESALAAGIVAPAVAAYAAGALAALGRVRECEELSQRLLAHPHAGPLRPARTIWESQKLLLAGDLDELIRGAEEAIREFERFDPLNRLPQLAQFLAIALGDQDGTPRRSRSGNESTSSRVGHT
jgi:ATP/maltotriose-dependent transcriptional regulator MalT